MALVHHNKDKKDIANNVPKRRGLTAGPSVQVANQVKRTEVTGERGATDATVTYTANIRVDNHVRNQIQALQNLGLAKSALDMVSQLLDARVEQLDSDALQRYNEMVAILEKMDANKRLNSGK